MIIDPSMARPTSDPLPVWRTPIDRPTMDLILRAADAALCDISTGAGRFHHEVTIFGHWGNVEHALSMLPEAVRAAGDSTGSELKKRVVCWQVLRS